MKHNPQPLVYMPILHPSLLPQGLPEAIQTLSVGLPRTPQSSHTTHSEYALSLPYTPAQAAACLADLQRLDEGCLHASWTAPDTASLSHEEQQAVAAFSQRGNATKALSCEEDAQRRWAHRFLLLGWLQEQNVLDLQKLAERYHASARQLAAQLGTMSPSLTDTPLDLGTEAATKLTHETIDPALMNGLMQSMQDVFPDDPMTLLPSWRFMIDVLAVLLPRETIWCTADSRMAVALETNGCTQPLAAADELALPSSWYDPDFPWHVTWGRIPLWRLVGKSAPLADKPWLDAMPCFVYMQQKTSSENV